MVAMTWRMMCVLALVLAGCGDSEGSEPPPIGPGSANGTLTVGATTATDTNATGTATGTDSDTAPTGMQADSTSVGPDEFVVISGGFVDGGASVNLPIECQVTFYEPGQIEPSTAMEQGGFLFRLSGFVVDAYPQSFEIQSAQVPMVERGQEGYAAARCDGDGDGQYDDGLVGYFPALPLQRVTIPATNVFIPIVSM
jgi:hypothetical protein